MQQYVKQYVVILAATVLAMFIYRWSVVPAIEPRTRAAIEPISYSEEVTDIHWWQQLFPADSWQNSKPMVLQTARGLILFKDWKHLDDDRWQLSPLTMIIPQANKRPASVTTGNGDGINGNGDQLADQDVWIINAEAGAVIQFREAFDWTKGQTPPVTGGRLVGPVNITRRSKDAAANPWSLVTRDIQIDQRRVWTGEPVEIRWSNSVIRGRDLSIYLKQDLLDGTPSDPSPWGVLENMELIYIDEINIALPPGGLWQDRKQTSPRLPVVQGLPARLLVESGGPFRFDFTNSQATLMNGIHATHQLGGLRPDQFWCQELQLKLEPPSASPAPALDDSAVDLGGLLLKKLSARGVDPGPIGGQSIVHIDAPNIGAAVRAKRLNVSFSDNQIELIGKLESPQAVNTVAMLDYLGYSFRSPVIQYRRDPQGMHLGWLAADGPGEVIIPPDSSMGQCNIRWQSSLVMKPEGEEQWVSLAGKTLIESKVHGFMTSESVEVWLKPNPDAARAPRAAAAGSSDSLASSSYLPDRLRANGSVTLAAAQIKAMVNELKLWIDHVRPAGPAPDAIPLADSAGNPMYQFVSPPESAPTNAPVAENNLPANTPLANEHTVEASPKQIVVGTPQRLTTEPITVEGQVLQTRIKAGADESWIDYLTIDGPLRVFRETNAPNTMPLNITGQQLHLTTNPAGEADVQITGAPAKIGMGDAWLIGSVVHYDQRTGSVWMEHPGEFTVPSEALIAGDNPNGSGSELRWLKAPHCKWQGSLLFDGKVARIKGDIEFTGVVSNAPDRLWFVDGFCQQIDVYLKNPIDLKSPKPGASAELDQVVLSNAVDLRAAQTDSRGNRLSLQRFVVPTLTYHLTHSQLVGAGPGWIRTWHASESKPSEITSSTETRVAPQMELQGAHLNFRQSMVAYMDRSEVVFEGKVELATGPLQSWEDMIDLNTMQRLKNDQMLLSCDLMKAYDTSGLAGAPPAAYTSTGGPQSAISQLGGAWEFQAIGNVRFAGKSPKGDYSGNGYRVTYTQAKDLMLLEGDGRMPARVKLIPVDTSLASSVEADVNSAAFNVKTMQTQNLRVTRVSGTDISSAAPGSAQNPSPRPDIPAASPRNGVSDWLRPKQ